MNMELMLREAYLYTKAKLLHKEKKPTGVYEATLFTTLKNITNHSSAHGRLSLCIILFNIGRDKHNRVDFEKHALMPQIKLYGIINK